MNIALNLAVPPKWRERYAFAVAAPSTLVAAVVLIVLLRAGMSEYREYGRLRQVNADPEHHEQRLRLKEIELRRDLERPEFGSTLREAQFVNELIGRRQFSISALAQTVGRLLPVDARLNGMGVSRHSNNTLVRLDVAGKTEEALEKFVSSLENSPDFPDVAVASQGFQPGQGSQPGEVSVSCTARYLADKGL